MNIGIEIEDLLEKNATDFEISQIFKSYIATYNETLPKVFESSQGKDFLVRHTKTLDTIITQMYKVVLRQVFGNYQPMRGSIPIALIALGSYGREQLSIHSDIDLLIVFEECEGYNINAIIEKVLYLAWDAGLKLGHRVHEVNDLLKASREDLTIRTSFMETRLIYGSTFTWHAAQRQIDCIRHDDPKAFILAKIDEAHMRREKYPFSMQPNIKESVGGLRDTNLLFWIARTIYGVSMLKQLSGELFSDNAYKEFAMALELLYRVRSALHLLAGKQQDQLLLEHIPSITRLLGFKSDQKLATEVIKANWRINNFTKIFVKKMIRPYIYEPNTIARYKSARVAPGFYAIDNRLFAAYGHGPRPVNVLLEMLLTLDDIYWLYDPSLLSQFTYTIIEHPLDEETYALLRKMFQRKHLYPFLKIFYDAGILHQIITPFRKVLHLPQFDGYHQFPVDYHSIDCLKALESISDPFIDTLYQTCSDDERSLLKVVVLLHDAGKGRKQDHSEVGAKLIVPFLKHLGFKEQMIDQAVLLVRHHILMSKVSQREDIHSEKTLYRLMSIIKTENNLKLLYILTYADINGVGPGIYHSFTAKLLRDLFDSCMEIVQQSDRITDAKKRLAIERRIERLPDYQMMPRLLKKKIHNIESNYFFFKHTPLEILSIIQYAKNVGEYNYRFHTKDYFSIEIFRRKEFNLGYFLGKLRHLDVASMEIFTLFDGIKFFKIDFLKPPEHYEPHMLEEIIEDAFNMDLSVKLTKPKIRSKDVTLDCEHSKTYAQLDIYAENQRGLLAYVLKTLEDLDINVATAKIHSTKKRVRDHFLLEKQGNMCHNAEQIITILTK